MDIFSLIPHGSHIMDHDELPPSGGYRVAGRLNIPSPTLLCLRETTRAIVEGAKPARLYIRTPRDRPIQAPTIAGAHTVVIAIPGTHRESEETCIAQTLLDADAVEVPDGFKIFFFEIRRRGISVIVARNKVHD